MGSHVDCSRVHIRNVNASRNNSHFGGVRRVLRCHPAMNVVKMSRSLLCNRSPLLTSSGNGIVRGPLVSTTRRLGSER